MTSRTGSNFYFTVRVFVLYQQVLPCISPLLSLCLTASYTADVNWPRSGLGRPHPHSQVGPEPPVLAKPAPLASPGHATRPDGRSGCHDVADDRRRRRSHATVPNRTPPGVDCLTWSSLVLVAYEIDVVLLCFMHEHRHPSPPTPASSAPSPRAPLRPYIAQTRSTPTFLEPH